MALIAAGIGAASAVIGLRGAYLLDTPAGPSIVCVAALCFAATSLLRAFRSGVGAR
jgi:zinc transport system permease protein